MSLKKEYKKNSDNKKQKNRVKVFTKKKKTTEPEEAFIQKLRSKYSEIVLSEIQTFSELPLSPKTIKGLKDSGYVKPTEIQRECIGFALQGEDILGAAQTGSGKTLAFIIPILEKLYCQQWSKVDGLGALVITPTRELAYQIFETLRHVGQHHDFSAGLIIGGKDLKFERGRMDQCNIIICTPGRILQHMDENPLFDCANLQILVLDEADRCLDMGFKKTMNAVIANFPPTRQTLLFSATQTRSVQDLARLSLKDPKYVSVHEHAKHSTPPGLEQSYMVCELHEKVSVIWSFIKNHPKNKIIIFLSTCKQVKYFYETFCKLRPGVSLLPLYGTLHQTRRMNIYDEFKRKQSAVLFATDLVARGLDFPEVHWVLQADCPEDPETYIHRVGRTARYFRGGQSLLLLLPSELPMLELLNEKKIPVKEIKINQEYLKDPVRKIEAFLVSNPDLKETAQRCFMHYIRSVFLMKNKKVFDIEKLDTALYSKSLGLPIPPRVRFVERRKAAENKKNKQKENEHKNKNKITKCEDPSEKDEDNNDNKNVAIEDFCKAEDSDSDDDLLTVKRKDHDVELPTDADITMVKPRGKGKDKPITKVAIIKKMLKLKNKNVTLNKKITFDEDGNSIVRDANLKRSELAQEYEKEDIGGIDIEQARRVLKEEDKFDKELFKERVKAQKKEKKKKLKQKKIDENVDDFGEEDSDEGPDLSWLPDPDKIYGKANSEDNDEISDNNSNNKDGEEVVPERTKKSKTDRKRKLIEEMSDNNIDDINNSDGEEAVPERTKKSKKGKKRKLIETNKETLKKKQKKMDPISKNLTVNEAEELAMLLLRNK